MSYLYLIVLVSFSIGQNAPYFDGEKAFSFIEKQCSFGPRNPGSDSHVEFKDYLVNYLNQSGLLINLEKKVSEKK